MVRLPSELSQPVASGVDILRAIIDAMNDSAKVINLSLGNDTTGTLVRTAASDSVKIANAHLMMQTIRDFATTTQHPLFVFSAGNGNGIDAYWTTLASIADSLPSERLIVAASSGTKGALASFSSTGSLVDVAAPGINIALLGSGGSTVGSGTSFAAPLVSGVAGLIFSLNPTLTASDVRSLIINGAIGGDSAGGKPIVNAYKSLQMAAQAHGAGICGNRVWTDGREIRVERTPGSSDLIATLPVGDTAYSLEVDHSNRMYVWGTVNGHVIKFTGGAWVDSAAGGYPGGNIGGTDMAMWGLSHDADSGAYAGASAGSSDNTPGWRVYIDHPSGTKDLGVVTRPMQAPSVVCVETLHGACIHSLDISSLRSGISIEATLQEPAVGYSPRGDEVFIAIPVFSNSVVSHWVDCQGSIPSAEDLCLSASIDRASDSTVVTAIKISNSAKTRLWSVPSKRIVSIGASEGGALDFVSRSYTVHNTFTWTYGRGPSGSATVATACSTDFRNRSGSNPESKPLAPGITCPAYFNWSGGGSIAPDKLVPGVRLIHP